MERLQKMSISKFHGSDINISPLKYIYKSRNYNVHSKSHECSLSLVVSSQP